MMQVVPNSFETLLLLKELVFSATTQLSTNMYYLKYILSNSFELYRFHLLIVKVKSVPSILKVPESYELTTVPIPGFNCLTNWL